MSLIEAPKPKASADWPAIYLAGGLLAGGLASLAVFVGCWLYCIASYGFLIGVCFGWIPAGICAAIVGAIVRFAWPLLALGLVILLIHRSAPAPASTAASEAVSTPAPPLPIPNTAATVGELAATAAPPPPDGKAINRALADYALLHASGGIAADVTATLNCYSKLAATSAWPEWDYCAAFDLAGERESQAAVRQSGVGAGTEFFADGSVDRRQTSSANAMRSDFNGNSDRIAALKAIFDQQLAVAFDRERSAAAGPLVSDAAASLPTPRPTFDCGRVQSEVLRLVCSTPTLAVADQDMASAYREALAKAPSAAILKAGQQEWIAKRNNSAADVPTLAATYEQRTQELKAVAATGDQFPATMQLPQ